MFCGAAATIDTRTLVRMRCFLHRYYRRLFVIAGLGVGLELLIGQDWLSWTQPIQVGIYILLCVLVFYASQTLSVARSTNLWMSGCWFLFCLTPYVGIQFQHTAAMLSNLRVDNGCHNSLLFPSSWIGQDTYLRIHRHPLAPTNGPNEKRFLNRAFGMKQHSSRCAENGALNGFDPYR